MKYALLTLLLMSFSAVAADSLKDFQKELLGTVESEIKSDDFHLRDKKAPMRGPASVEPVHAPAPQRPSKVEEIRQLGPSEW